MQEQNLLSFVRRGRRKSARLNAVTIRLGCVGTGGGPTRSRLRTRLLTPDDGAQRTGHFQSIPRKRTGLGAGTAEDEKCAREQIEDKCSEGIKIRTDAHDANVSAAARQEEVVFGSSQSKLPQRPIKTGSERAEGTIGGNGMGTMSKNWRDFFIEIAIKRISGKT